MTYVPSYQPAKPRRVTKLNPVIVRALHMSSARQDELVQRIERTAELTYAIALSPFTEKQEGRG